MMEINTLAMVNWSHVESGDHLITGEESEIRTFGSTTKIKCSLRSFVCILDLRPLRCTISIDNLKNKPDDIEVGKISDLLS